MKKMEINLTSEEIKLLKKEKRQNPKEKVRNKAKVLLLRNDGYTEREIIQKTDLTPATIVSYVKTYLVDGIDSIYKTKCKGQKSLLDPYKEEILNDFKKEPPTTRDEARQRIYAKYGIKIGRTAIGNFLKKRVILQKIKKHSSKSKKRTTTTIFGFKDITVTKSGNKG